MVKKRQGKNPCPVGGIWNDPIRSPIEQMTGVEPA